MCGVVVDGGGCVCKMGLGVFWVFEIGMRGEREVRVRRGARRRCGDLWCEMEWVVICVCLMW